jgi:hypothetical protein
VYFFWEEIFYELDGLSEHHITSLIHIGHKKYERRKQARSKVTLLPQLSVASGDTVRKKKKKYYAQSTTISKALFGTKEKT